MRLKGQFELIGDVTSLSLALTGYRMIGGDYAVEQSDHGCAIVVTAPGAVISVASIAADLFSTVILNATARRIWIAGARPRDALLSLMPGMRVTVTKTGGVITHDRPPVWRVENFECFIDPTSGNDANDGLTEDSAFRTGTRAFDFVNAEVHCAGTGPTATVISPDFEAGGWVNTKTLVGNHAFYLRAKPGIWCRWRVPAGQIGLQTRDGGITLFDGFDVSGGAGAIFSMTGHGGISDVGTNRFGSFPGGYHIAAAEGGHVGFMANARPIIYGGALAHAFAEDNGNVNFVNGEAYTIEQPVTFDHGFVKAIYRNSGIKMSGTTFAGRELVTGRPFYRDADCRMEFGVMPDGVVPNSFPGNQPGYVAPLA